MKIYSDTELVSDIKYMKEVFSKCCDAYKDIEHNFEKLNKTVLTRTGFILSQFRNVFYRSIAGI